MTFKPVEVTRLMDNCRVNLPGALDGAIQQQIFNVLCEFFDTSNCWTEDITFNVTPANTKGSLTDIAQSAGKIIRLGYVLDENGFQMKMTMPTPGTLMFVDVPSQAATWTAHCSISIVDPVPSSGTQAGVPAAPDWVLTKYIDGLVGGVTGNMMMQVGKPYSNTKLAMAHLAKYRRALGEARAEAMSQNLLGGQAWTFPSFAGRRSSQ